MPAVAPVPPAPISPAGSLDVPTAGRETCEAVGGHGRQRLDRADHHPGGVTHRHVDNAPPHPRADRPAGPARARRAGPDVVYGPAGHAADRDQHRVQNGVQLLDQLLRLRLGEDVQPLQAPGRIGPGGVTRGGLMGSGG
jgi:hypothetical protein